MQSVIQQIYFKRVLGITDLCDLVPLAAEQCKKTSCIAYFVEWSLGQLVVVAVVIVEMNNNLIPNVVNH